MSLTPTAGRTGAWLTDTARRLSPLSRRGLLVAWDCMAWVLAVVVFTVVRYDITLTPAQWTWVVVYTVAVVSLQIVLGLITHLYLGRSRLGSFSEVSWLGGLVVLIGFPVGVALSLAGLPRGLAVVVPPIALVIMAAGRWAFRMAFSAAVTGRRSADPDATPALVYGAGDAGHQVAMLVDRAVDAPYSIAGFLDDDAAKRFLRVGRRLNDSMGAYVASQFVKAMSKQGRSIQGARVLVLGLTFKENTPDLRNSRVIDVIRELEDYEVTVDVHDPWVDPDAARAEYGVDLVADPPAGSYDGIILAVAHRQFRELGVEGIREYGAPGGHTLYDLKHVIGAEDSDLRL